MSPEVYLGVRLLEHELMEHDFLRSSFENIRAPLISLSTSIVPQVSCLREVVRPHDPLVLAPVGRL